MLNTRHTSAEISVGKREVEGKWKERGPRFDGI